MRRCGGVVFFQAPALATLRQESFPGRHVGVADDDTINGAGERQITIRGTRPRNRHCWIWHFQSS